MKLDHADQPIGVIELRVVHVGNRRLLNEPTRDSTYRAIFLRANGRGPYSCDYCGHDVFWPEVVVHHRDHDHDNDELSNLGPMHHECHTRHHRTGLLHSEESKQRMSVTRQRLVQEGVFVSPMKGRSHTVEARELLRAASTGQVQSDEVKKRKNAANRGRTRARGCCVKCRRELAVAYMSVHKCAAIEGTPGATANRRKSEALKGVPKPRVCCVLCRRDIPITARTRHRCVPYDG